MARKTCHFKEYTPLVAVSTTYHSLVEKVLVEIRGKDRTYD